MAIDPGWLDMIGFAGASRAETGECALHMRAGLPWFAYPPCLVHMHAPRDFEGKPIGVFLKSHAAIGRTSIRSWTPDARVTDFKAIETVRVEPDRLTT